jgi:hypothetical protein
MLPVGFESAIPASEQRQTHALERAATGIGSVRTYRNKFRGAEAFGITY